MKRAVVTGGGTGIGRAIAERLSFQGTRVIIVGRRAEVLAGAAADLNKRHHDELVEYCAADLTDPDQVEQLASRITAEGNVDILVNNAGGNFAADAPSLTGIADGYRADFEGNVLTAVLLTEALLPAVSRPGRIVMMSSVAGLRGAGSYGVAKAALHGYVWDLANRLAAQEVTVNAIAPGFVPDTEFWEGRRNEESVRSRLARIPMGRAGTPSEVAEAVAYLCSNESGWTTGQILQVNGGTLLGHG
ncbi:SDR family NAD(P)-dependent oxidoreductase [Microlunatus sp. Gsoil 973]|uniref:SDR family NAD(P)-dependent oxidoreductase n=1 Tax=Microlunatus sp. Gsoil 973 TaxID=2672569 RepID=UPI001E57DF45|nr:SDR family oxidoreductase [Microlunatus sp. Gsoil 973]